MQILINLLLKDVSQIALIFLPLVTFNIIAIKPHRCSLSPRKRTLRLLNACAIRRGMPCRVLQDSGLPYQKSSPLLYFFIFLFLFLVTTGPKSLIILYTLLRALSIFMFDALIYILPYLINDPELLLYMLYALIYLRHQEVTIFQYFLHNPGDFLAYYGIIYAVIAARAYWTALGFTAGLIIFRAITKWFGRFITPQQCSHLLFFLIPSFLLLVCFGPSALATLVVPVYLVAPSLKLDIYRLWCFLTGDEVATSIEARLLHEQIWRAIDAYDNPSEFPSDVLYIYPGIVIAYYVILGLITGLIVSCVTAQGLDCFKPQQYSRPHFFHALFWFLVYFVLLSLYNPTTFAKIVIRSFLFLVDFAQFVLAVLMIASAYILNLSFSFFYHFGWFVHAVSIALAYFFEPTIDLFYYLLGYPLLGDEFNPARVIWLLYKQFVRPCDFWNNRKEVLEFVESTLNNIEFADHVGVGLIASLIVFCVIMMMGGRGGFKSRLKDSPSSALVHLAGAGLLLCIAAGIASLSTPARGLLIFLALVYRAILALLAMVLAIFVSMSWSPMHSLLALIGVFLLAVGVYFSSGAEFLGLAFLIVYVGAVAILFLFVIMLLNVKSLTSYAAQHVRRYQALSLVAGVCLGLTTLFLNYCSFLYRRALDLVHSLGTSVVAALVCYVNYGASDVMAFATLYSKQAALFLIETVILLIAMLGAIVLATATLDEEETLLSLNGSCFSVAGLCVMGEFITPAAGSELASTLFGAVLLRPLVIPQYCCSTAMYITPDNLPKLLRDAALDWWAEHRARFLSFFSTRRDWNRRTPLFASFLPYNDYITPWCSLH